MDALGRPGVARSDRWKVQGRFGDLADRYHGRDLIALPDRTHRRLAARFCWCGITWPGSGFPNPMIEPRRGSGSGGRTHGAGQHHGGGCGRFLRLMEERFLVQAGDHENLVGGPQGQDHKKKGECTSTGSRDFGSVHAQGGEEDQDLDSGEEHGQGHLRAARQEVFRVFVISPDGFFFHGSLGVSGC